MGKGSLKACIEILAASKGRKFVPQASVNWPDEMPSSAMGWASTGLSMVLFKMSMAIKSKVRQFDTKFTFGTDLMANEVSRAIYEDYLPAALAEGKHIAAPEPQVVGQGLAHVQEAMGVNPRGVSAKKTVVSL